MNVNEFLEHYERIADSRDAVARMRQLVIDLAVRGKLVDQDPNEMNVTQLLGQITQAQSARAEKAAKRTNSGWLLGESEHPFRIPSSWRFVRLGGVLKMINGRAFKPSDWIPRGLPIVRIQNLNNVTAPFNYCDPDLVDQRHRIDNGEFLISWSGTPGTSFGAFIWQRGPAALNQHIFRCVQLGNAFVPSFLRLAINSQLHVLIAKAQGGVGLQHVTKGTLEALALPLPSVEEQRRILAKVDELMGLCDQLEKARADRETKRDKLTAAILARLNTPDPETFRGDARFALENLQTLTTRSDQIKQVRRTILNLAVHGRLVDRAEFDESAEVTIPGTPGKQDNGRPPSHPIVAPYEIPRWWTWSRLDLVTLKITDGEHLSPQKTRSGMKLLTAKHVLDGGITLDDPQYVSVEDGLRFRQRCDPRTGDVLICSRGTIGRCCAIEVTESFCLMGSVILVRPSACIDARYLDFYLKSDSGQYFIRGATKGMAVNALYLKDIRLCPIPLPPVAEQLRIVKRVQELMSICDALERSLMTGDTTRSRLLGALLSTPPDPPPELGVHGTQPEVSLVSQRQRLAS